MANAVPGPILPASEETLHQLQKAESIGQLAQGVGHDFNNSLQNVMVSLEMLRRLIAAERFGETERFIAKAIQSAQQAAALNQRFVVFAHRRTPNPQPLSMNTPISGMEDLLRRSLPGTFKLSLDLAADLWEVLCDSNDAEAALVNLVLNARDALPAGGTITIRTANTDHPAGIAPGQYVCMSVSDAGTGMSQETLEKAFDAFFTTKADAFRHGLGLTMVRRFARELGGDAGIESAPGRGTSVRVFLPRHRASSADGH